jgi:hypothetical protein
VESQNRVDSKVFFLAVALGVDDVKFICQGFSTISVCDLHESTNNARLVDSETDEDLERLQLVMHKEYVFECKNIIVSEKSVVVDIVRVFPASHAKQVTLSSFSSYCR